MTDYTDIEDCLKKVFLHKMIQETMKTMIGVDFYEVKIDDMHEENFTTPFVSGSLFLIGSKNLLVTLNMSAPIANIVVSILTGIKIPDIKKENLCDGVMEMTNIISGKLKSLLSTQGKLSYTLSPPFVIHGNSYSICYRKKQSGVIVKYKAGVSEMILRILFI